MSATLDFQPATVSVADGTVVEFKSFADWQVFVHREEEAFRAVLAVAPDDGNAQAALQNLQAKFRAIKKAFNGANATMQSVAAEQALPAERASEFRLRLAQHQEQLRNAVMQGYNNGPVLLWLSNSPKAQFVIELSRDNPAAAAYAMFYLMGQDFSSTSHQAKRGVFRAQLFEAGISNLRGDAEAAALKLLTEGWRAESKRMADQFEALQSVAKNHNDDQSGKIAALTTQASDIRTAFEVFINEKSKEISAQREAAEGELMKLVQTYDEHMKLKAPVAYWSKKKARHITERRNLTLWTIGVGAGGFVLLVLYVVFLFKPTDKVPWREILLFFVVSSLVFWVAKILVRLLLSSIHLAEDAAEREVMAETYMALMRGDGSTAKYLDEKDRALVLAPLFRPSSTGVIDDGAPPHLSDIATKLTQR